MEHKIDAEKKILGRLASEVAQFLLGKNSPDFDPAKFSDNKVVVYNIDKIVVTGKKSVQKSYYRHSGYIGNLKEEKLKDLMARDSRLVFKKAVLGMLPKNKLRMKMIKNLILMKGEK